MLCDEPVASKPHFASRSIPGKKNLSPYDQIVPLLDDASCCSYSGGN